MRIQEDSFEDSDAYTPELRHRVMEVLAQACLLDEIQTLIESIRQEVLGWRDLILSEDEQSEIEKTAANFDTRMQYMALATFDNLEQYRLGGWKDLIRSGDEDDG